MKKAFLFLLGLIATIGAWAQTSPYTGAELAEGDFFFYNVETGLWLQNNDGRNTSDWNTRGAVGSYGFEFGISAIEGGYKLDPKFGGNHSMNGSNFYLDTPDAVTAWTIEEKEASDVTNAYTIKFGDQVLGLDDSDNLAFTDSKSTWQLVTRAERVAYLEANASADNPIDATFLINDPSFANANERASSWVWDQNGGNKDDVRWYWCRRSYAIWNSTSFTIKQTITDVPDGKYNLTLKGYYRDGDRDEVVARRQAGNERILANYFINEAKAPMMSILDGASETWIDGLFYYPAADADAPYGHYPDNADGFNRIFQDYPEAYTNAGVTGIVTGGTLTIGLEKLEANAKDWVSFDDFRIQYLGNEIDLSEFLAALEAAIAAADEFNSDNTSAALKDALAEAYENATAARISTDQQEITSATSALNAALNAAKAVDVSVLKATAALAKEEGLDTSVADDVVANATDAGAVESALFDLRAARKINAQKMPDIYTGSEPAEGKVYLYNLGTGMFLGTGASYNTHCAVDQVGIEVELIADGDGFKMKTNRGSGWLAKGNRETTTYVDCSTQQVWHFISVSDGIYNISFDGTAENLLGYNPLSVNDEGKTYWSSIGIKRTDVSDPNNQWKIVTAEEREALLAEASKENPVDVSYLIGAASLNKQDDKDAAWTKDGGAWVDNFENHAFECWDADNFKLSQTIEGLKPGLYQVAVQAFWREGDGGNQAALANAGTLNQKAYLFANDAQVLLPNIASVTDFVPGVGGEARCNNGIFPNWVSEAIEYMETGAYWAVEDVVVEEDGTLTLGIAVDEKVAFGDWVVADNFRLTYLGEASDYDRALASIEDGKNYSVFTEIEGQKYYVTADGKLTDDETARGAFTFEKVTGGDYEEYGYKMKNGAVRFTNPPLTNNVANLTPGAFATTTQDRNNWDAQVFFQQGDLYAIRSSNVHDATSSWNDAGRTYWTFSVEEAPTPEYTYDRVYLWQLEENQTIDLNLVYEEKVLATEKAALIAGTPVPAAPASFKTNETIVSAFKGLVYFTPDADELTEETTEVNYAAQSAISESFENAKWFNMNIRGSYWVNMDETEPYYPTTSKDLTADASMWAFGLVEGATSEQIVIWNRAAGADMSLKYTGENDSNGKPLVAMREGQTAWEAFSSADGFVIRQVGSGENMYVNQNGGSQGPFSIWNSASARNDAGSVLRIYPVEVEEEGDALELTLDVERYPGLGYNSTEATVDFTEAKEYLGVEEVTDEMLYFINPDGTWIDYATYAVSPDPDFTYDGWCDAEGAAAQWGETTMINVKFFQAIPDGAYTVCDMNGADEVGKTYTVKWGLKANDKSVVYTINVTFVEAPVVDLTFEDLEIVQTEELDVKSEVGDFYEGLTATVDIDNILEVLEVESLDDVTITAVQPDGTLDLSYKLGTTDGWRDADGSWMGWSGALENAPYFFVKADFAGDPQLYEIGGYPGHTDEAAKFTAPYAFIVTGTTKAYLLNVNLIYPVSETYEGTLDQTVAIRTEVVAETTGDEESVTIAENGDGTVNITFSGFTMALPTIPMNEFTIENVPVTENEDGSKSYTLFDTEITLTAQSGMNMIYSATLNGTQAEGEGPELTLTLAQPTGMSNTLVFHPNAIEPEPTEAEFAGMIKQILSHPQTGVQGQATGEQTVKIEVGEDGKANITYSGFTMPVTGAVLPEFTVEGVEVTENEDGSISYALPEDAEAEVVIDRGTGEVIYKVALEGTQENAEATPVLKLVLDNSVIDTVWFGADEKTIDKAIVTAINGLNALGTEGTVFDLSGRKVEKIQRAGIYIVNGKKVSVK